MKRAKFHWPARLTYLSFAIGCFALLLFGFQNCLSGDFGRAPASVTAANSAGGGVGGNGQGYDGKPYYHLADQVCADGNRIDSIIELRGTIGYLVRDNCQNIPVAVQQAVAYTFLPYTQSVLLYQNKLYVDQVVQAVVAPTQNAGGDGYVSVGSQWPIDGGGNLSGLPTTFVARFASDFALQWSKSSSWLEKSNLLYPPLQWSARADGAAVMSYSNAVKIIGGPSPASFSIPPNEPHILIVDTLGRVLSSQRVVPTAAGGASLLSPKMIVTDRGLNMYIVSTVTSSTGSSLDIISKMNASGNHVWSQQILTGGTDVSLKLLMSGSDELYAYSNDRASASLLLKINPASGACLWSKSYVGASLEILAADSMGLIISHGVTSTTHPVPSVTIFKTTNSVVALTLDGAMSASATYATAGPVDFDEDPNAISIGGAAVVGARLYGTRHGVAYAFDRATLGFLGGFSLESVYSGASNFLNVTSGAPGTVLAGASLTPANTAYPTTAFLHLPEYSAAIWPKQLTQNISATIVTGAGPVLTTAPVPFELIDVSAPAFTDFRSTLSLQ